MVEQVAPGADEGGPAVELLLDAARQGDVIGRQPNRSGGPIIAVAIVRLVVESIKDQH
jgi:hypothetical protein